MNTRTRWLMAALRRLPRPEPPSPAYLAAVRRELPPSLARALLGRVERGVTLRDITVPTTDTLLSARVYRRRDSPPNQPLVINFHGGGFVFGNLTAADWLCGNVAARAGVTVVSVEYRLAPEHPAPIPFLDSWAATRWLVQHAQLLDVDPERVSVMGESAGGNLAALITLAARDLAAATLTGRACAARSCSTRRRISPCPHPRSARTRMPRCCVGAPWTGMGAATCRRASRRASRTTTRRSARSSPPTTPAYRRR